MYLFRELTDGRLPTAWSWSAGTFQRETMQSRSGGCESTPTTSETAPGPPSHRGGRSARREGHPAGAGGPHGGRDERVVLEILELLTAARTLYESRGYRETASEGGMGTTASGTRRACEPTCPRSRSTARPRCESAIRASGVQDRSDGRRAGVATRLARPGRRRRATAPRSSRTAALVRWPPRTPRRPPGTSTGGPGNRHG